MTWLLTILTVISAHAANDPCDGYSRIMYTAPAMARVKGRWVDNGGSSILGKIRGGYLNGRVALTNITKIPQTVTITLETFDVDIFIKRKSGDPAPWNGWTGPAGSNGFSKDIGLFNRVDNTGTSKGTITKVWTRKLQPYSTITEAFAYACQLGPQTTCYDQPHSLSTANPAGSNLIKRSVWTFATSIRVCVKENLGALVGSASYIPGLSLENGDDEEIDDYAIANELNGGRPF